MNKTSAIHQLGLLSAALLAACGGSSGESRSSAAQDAVLLADGSSARESALWVSQNPTGEVIQAKLPDQEAPTDLVVKGQMAFLGDMAIGHVHGNQLLGSEGQFLQHIDGSALHNGRESPLGSGIVNAPRQKWPNAVIPYEFDPAATQATRNAFETAKRDYDAKTVIRFVPRTNQANYVRVITGDGCYSYVGTIGGRQDMSIGNGCSANAARHEMGHALGLAHEQVRQDRDRFVKVNLDLLGNTSQYDIDKGSAGTPIGDYDFESMMHYNNYKVNGRWIFEPKMGFPPEQIGNGRYNTFTPGDLQAVAAIYGTPGGSGIALALDTWVSFRVRNEGLTNRYLRHQGSLGFTEVITGGSTALLKADASFKVVRALDGTPCYSLQSSNYPDHYLRHQNYRLRIDRNDGSALFRQDATFCAQTGLANSGGVSLVSRNLPGHYIRHYRAEVWMAKKGAGGSADNANLFEDDVSWDLVNAWAPGR
jgi:Alpha-L-arabinofuranosidase B (ABFB) domain/Astacin (Peptidase family M12A)